MYLDVIDREGNTKGIVFFKGVKIRPALGVDGDTFLCADDIDIVTKKVNLLKKATNMLNGDSSKFKVIPLYEKLSAEKCEKVINIAFNYTATGFISELVGVFDTDGFEEWIGSHIEEKLSIEENLSKEA